MPRLTRGLFEPILNYLTRFCKTRSDRESLLTPILSTWQGYDRIEWEGQPRAFTARLIEQLPPDQLKAVLMSAQDGSEPQEVVVAWCAEIEAARRSLGQLRSGASVEQNEASPKWNTQQEQWSEGIGQSAHLRQLLNSYFNDSELRNLCFDLEIEALQDFPE